MFKQNGNGLNINVVLSAINRGGVFQTIYFRPVGCPFGTTVRLFSGLYLHEGNYF